MTESRERMNRSSRGHVQLRIGPFTLGRQGPVPPCPGLAPGAVSHRLAPGPVARPPPVD